METNVIIYGAYALVYVVIAGLLLFASTKTVEQFKAFVPTLAPWLKKFFDSPTDTINIPGERISITKEVDDALHDAFNISKLS